MAQATPQTEVQKQVGGQSMQLGMGQPFVLAQPMLALSSATILQIQNLVASGVLGADALAVTQGPPPEARDAIAAIPIARDGEVIGSNYHNSLRTALNALLNQVDIGFRPAAPLAPAFREDGANKIWTLEPGIAHTPAVAAGETYKGWMPLDLAHGGVISRLVVTGQRIASVGTFLVEVSRQAISTDQAPAVQKIISLDLKAANPAFLESKDAGAPDVANPSASVLADRKLVDNVKYKYFLTATATVPAGTKAQINSIQVIVEQS